MSYLLPILDVLSMKVFLRVIGRDAGLLDAHLFFFDRYSELADYHRQRGRTDKALRLEAIAEEHFRAAPGDDEDDPNDPSAAAMAMPVPNAPIHTEAIGGQFTIDNGQFRKRMMIPL